MIWLILILLSPTDCSDSPYSAIYGRYKLIRLKPTDPTQLDALLKLANNASFYELDFWKEPSRVDNTVDVMVHNDSFYKVENYFNENNLSFNITMEDVQKFIEGQQKNSIKFSGKRYKDDSSLSRFNLGVYNSYPDIERYLDSLQRLYPNIVQVFSIGQTHEQRQLKVIKIGKPTGTSKKSLWIDAGIHAREWIAPSTALYFINQDKILLLPTKIKRSECGIINLENSDSGGSHWVAYYNCPNYPRVEYFDSFGVIPLPLIEKYLSTSNKCVTFNTTQYQPLESILCGFAYFS